MRPPKPEDLPTEIYTIEVLRGLAALSVAWFHLTSQYQWAWVRNSGSYGWLGVEVFFVISGFIIPYSLHLASYHLKQYPRFILRRIVRLEPPYIISILLVIVLWELSARAPGFAGDPPSFSMSQIAAHLFYLIPLTRYDWLNVVYWSLAYEFVFYILIGLFWPLLARMSGLITLSVFLIVFAVVLGMSGHPPVLIFLFLMGIAGARYYLNIDGLWMWVAISLVASCLISMFDSMLVGLIALTTVLIIVFIKIPRLKILSFLGAISYSLYLIHVPVGGRIVNLGKRFIDGSLLEFSLSLVALMATILLAAVYFKYIEAPAKRASKKLIMNQDRSLLNSLAKNISGESVLHHARGSIQSEAERSCVDLRQSGVSCGKSHERAV